MGNSLDRPITNKDSSTFISSTGLVAGATGMQGWRTEMEDAHITTDMPSLPNHLFLAVFDGHGGSGAAIYAEKHMVARIEETPQWKAYVESGATNPALLGEALIQAFDDIDAAMRIHQNSTNGQDCSGCTSVTAMITPDYIICANAGDSRCVLGTKEVIGMSEDHKPYDEPEKRRIERAGGTVQWKRVDGDLAVSRALGDFQYKLNDTLPARDQKVTFLPDIRIHERTGDDEVLILACDGLWDVMSNEEAVEMLRFIYLSGETGQALVAEEMVDAALTKGSRDNISAVVVALPGAKIGPASGGGVAAMREKRTPAPSDRPSGEEEQD